MLLLWIAEYNLPQFVLLLKQQKTWGCSNLDLGWHAILMFVAVIDDLFGRADMRKVLTSCRSANRAKLSCGLEDLTLFKTKQKYIYIYIYIELGVFGSLSCVFIFAVPFHSYYYWWIEDWLIGWLFEWWIHDSLLYW